MHGAQVGMRCVLSFLIILVMIVNRDGQLLAVISSVCRVEGYADREAISVVCIDYAGR